MNLECVRGIPCVKGIGLAALLLVGTACVEAASVADPMDDGLIAALNGAQYGKATGGGHYELAFGDGTLAGRFSLSGIQTSPDGSTAKGRFHHKLDFLGQLIDFKGEVTCLTIDAENGRAWVGGVITHNKSEPDPWASGEIYEPGKDIWFRVLDSGEGNGVHGRTTFVGFEGGAGIITSAEYCEKAIWPDGDARTWAVDGNVQVMP